MTFKHMFILGNMWSHSHKLTQSSELVLIPKDYAEFNTNIIFHILFSNLQLLLLVIYKLLMFAYQSLFHAISQSLPCKKTFWETACKWQTPSKRTVAGMLVYILPKQQLNMHAQRCNSLGEFPPVCDCLYWPAQMPLDSARQ